MFIIRYLSFRQCFVLLDFEQKNIIITKNTSCKSSHSYDIISHFPFFVKFTTTTDPALVINKNRTHHLDLPFDVSNCFLEVFGMKKMKMTVSDTVTFEEGCNKYLDNCRQRNLREGTINHYKQSYTQFYKYFDADMPVEDFTSDMYKQYVVYLRNTLQNDVSINSYLRDLITTLHFLMNEGYISMRLKAPNCDLNQTAPNSFLYSPITISFICSADSAQLLSSQVVITARSPLMKNVVL